MVSSSPLTVSLTPELRQFIQNQVATGRYQTASEVVRAGLRLLTMADPPRFIKHDEQTTSENLQKSSYP